MFRKLVYQYGLSFWYKRVDFYVFSFIITFLLGSNIFLFVLFLLVDLFDEGEGRIFT